jgi:LysM repeat protein
MRAYQYKKPESKSQSKVTLKSYSQKLNKLTSLIFSKPVLILSSSALFVMSNFFIVTALTQTSKADTQESFRLYTNDNIASINNEVNYEVNPEIIKAQQFTVYQVVKNDNLTLIASKTKNSVQEILENNDLIPQQSLKIGQALKVLKN